MNPPPIYNPAIKYFQTVKAQTFLGKAKNIGVVSKEEFFLIFSIFQSRSEHSIAFLTENLAKITAQVVENIHVGGMITHIAIALGLRNQVRHLEPLCGYNLINIEHCINRGLVRQEGPNTYKILVLREPVHQFNISNPDRTNVHNRDNWRYLLGNEAEYQSSDIEEAPSYPDMTHLLLNLLP